MPKIVEINTDNKNNFADTISLGDKSSITVFPGYL